MGRPIYPKWLEGLPPEERKNKTTSQLGVVIGESLGVSPAIVDNTIFGLTSTVGKQTIRASESMIDQFKRWNGEEVPEDIIIKKDIPLVGALIGRLPDGTRSKSYQQFANDYQNFLQIHTAYNQRSGADKAEYRRSHAFELEAYNSVKGSKKQIQKVNKELNRIYDDPKMSAADKTTAVTDLERKITEIARAANKKTEEIRNKFND